MATGGYFFAWVFSVDLKDLYSVSPVMIRGSNDPGLLVSQSMSRNMLTCYVSEGVRESMCVCVCAHMCTHTFRPGAKRSAIIFHRMSTIKEDLH